MSQSDSLTGPPVSSQVVMGGKVTDRIEDWIFFHSGGRAKKRKIAKSGGLALWTDTDDIVTQ